MNLDIENHTYRARLQEMVITHHGQYVVIKGGDLAHFSPSYNAALDWDYEAFGLDDACFVRKIAKDLDVAHFTRDLGPCHS